jgi:hypothetical protein
VAAALDPEWTLRVPPLYYDNRPAGEKWRMLGNDQWGCCTIAGIVRIMINNAAHRNQTIEITDQDVVDAYLALTNGQDIGAMPLNALTYMRNIGIKGHKVVAFARVDHADTYERQSAMRTFGSLYVAAALPARLDEDHDLRWELTPAEKRTSSDTPRSLGGHAYPVFGFQRHEEFAVPWTQEVIEELDWTNYYREEAWVFIDNHEEDQAVLDVMYAQLAAIKEKT